MLKRIAISLLSIAVAGCVVAEDDAAETTIGEAAALSDGDFVIKSVLSGKCIDISGGSLDSGAAVQQWDCNGTAAQIFHLISVGGGGYKIENKGSGKVLDVRDARTDPGAKLQQWDYGGGANQQFELLSQSNDEIAIHARHSGLTLDVESFSTANGAPILQWPFHGGANQRWKFERQGAVDPGGDGGSGGGGGDDPPTPPPTPSGAITIDGRQVKVGGTSIQLRGVGWNPVRKGGTHPNGLDYAGFAPRDIPLMKAAGVNAVRTYEPITDRGVLDQLQAAGIWVLMSVYAWGGVGPEGVVNTVNAVKDHPAILMWLVGNEWNYNGLYVGQSHEQALSTLNQAASLIRQNDEAHPIATIYGEVPSVETIAAMPDVDVWGLNVYRGIGFGDLFSTWGGRSGKPMFVSEYGADAFNAKIPGYDPNSQAEAVRALTSEIVAVSVAKSGNGVALGGAVFSWSDEWWKDGNGSPDTHDVGGIAPGGGPYPDQTFNEEWWGIVDIDRNTRPAYDALKSVYTGG